MLALTVRLLHGTIRAGTPDDTVLAGGEPVGEWPPSPARLYSALVAADGTGSRCTATTGEELAWLEGLGPPLIVASPPESVVDSPLQPRYVVVDEKAGGAVQDYPARSARRVHPGVKLAPKDDTIVYVWPDAEPTEIHRRALAYRAARVGYLGCADSPVIVSVTDRDVDSLVDTATWRHDDEGPCALPVPYSGFLDALDDAYLAWSAGEPMRRAWIPTRRVRYSPPRHDKAARVARSSRRVIWLRFERTVSSRRILEVTETLKAAVLDHLQRLLPGEELPSVLHGHRPPGERGSQADFFALPDVGHRHATGRLFGAAISLPSDVDPALLQQVRTAVVRLATEELVRPAASSSAGRGLRLRVGIYGGERRPWAVVPSRWSRPSHSWVSATPVVHERWSKSGPSIHEVERWCRHAGLPEEIHVVEVSFSDRPLLSGGIDLAPALVFRSREDRRPYSHLALRFDRPVEGPIVLGRGRQFGMGLLAPVDDRGGDLRG